MKSKELNLRESNTELGVIASKDINVHSSTNQLYKLKTTPAGRKLWTYMAAILEVTGMDQGKVFPLNKFFGNLKTHIDNGRIIRIDGGCQLTPSGLDYFNDRYNRGSRQHIEKSEVQMVIHAMTNGVNDDWIKVV